MGVVYRARDTRLHRTVAVKVAADCFSDRVARGERQIRQWAPLHRAGSVEAAESSSHGPAALAGRASSLVRAGALTDI
jgi:hypothetical protein